ncbi:MAG: methylmalonyl Co-A mutase-associated GTPase MeaB [Bryobacteraceae bacterium]|nr:methylmalonyl Co-A mutase-associated GTPase MeaB [Bryobacteraceae bacterium]
MTPAAERILAGDRRALARAATAVENRTPAARTLLAELFARTGRALTLGITGPPGAGKSTLTSELARTLRAEGRTVGILAVDPSSPYTGGAILGDRIRMQSHYADPGVFIRSMATRGTVGGIAEATGDLALLLDAAGFDTVLIETVGVGQDEVEIAGLADVTLVVLVPGMGDDVQAIKAGIMEIADLFVLNKADQPGIEKLEREVEFLLSLTHRPDGWRPGCLRTVASEGIGIGEVLAEARELAQSKGSTHETAWVARLRRMLRERLLEKLPEPVLRQAAQRVAARESDPYTLVAEWVERIELGKRISD